MEPPPQGKRLLADHAVTSEKCPPCLMIYFPCGPATTALAWLFLHTYIRPPWLARQGACHGDSGRSGRAREKKGATTARLGDARLLGRGLIITTSGPGLYHSTKEAGKTSRSQCCQPAPRHWPVCGRRSGGKKFGDARLAPGGKRRLQPALVFSAGGVQPSNIDRTKKHAGPACHRS